MVERELIAERTIYAIDKDSRGFEIRLMVGKPYQISPTEWACPVAMMGLHGALKDVHAVDSWQALTLVQELLRVLLILFVEQGGKLFSEKDGEEITVDSLFLEQLVETSDEDPEPDPPLTEEQQARVDQLTAEELQMIDDALIADACSQFRKVARIVGTAMMATEDSIKHIPDLFYASRVRKLVEEGRLVSEGNLEYMRFSEVKLPEK